MLSYFSVQAHRKYPFDLYLLLTDIYSAFIQYRNGIVQDVCVSAFCPESISEKYLPKKFKSDKDYRASVVEATRLAMWNGATFPSEFMETLAGCEYPLTLSASDICVTCGGSSYSGQMMQCHNCNVMQRHWHCFPLMNEGAWLCDSCCQVSWPSVHSVSYTGTTLQHVYIGKLSCWHSVN